ncbi:MULTISPECIES: colibactin biosynthesis dehydrogenase ClbD [unclassified Gilliamella]|uniref:colibactin biosynthesis dehydrogenase ClbD n=1 Tax=unclassified Gilliamella TaxID=2685620 RepID=UPI00080E809B|nr:colibactin biosynthesis dehydrogenase ClbD [Gilliamella apicola]OCG20183.1 3-hydroxybutyryl-CoA dehydrogenase [Gilliamella apicola]OCG21777.1 3-hydroxybutyryl-CoA dehydrogenase [Gilliamella apicola]
MKVAVIGAGVMGTGVAHNLAQYGISTIVVDNCSTQLDHCQKAIKANLRLYHFHPHHKKDTASVKDIMKNIHFTTSLTDISQCDLVIENITEDVELKTKLYREMNQICDKDTVFGVNTSAISITAISRLIQNPENVVGIHFMNPVPLMHTVEMIRGVHSCEQALSKFHQLFALVNKTGIVVNDSPGFVTNRAMMIFVNEAIFMVQENIAKAEDIDTLFKTCFGHKMGPLQTADLIGLDTILKSLEVLYESFNDDKYRPCFLLKKMVDAGYLGTKSGQGFYSYQQSYLL